MVLQRLLAVREGRLLRQLGAAMAAANAAAGGALTAQEATFETWMKRESDLVQVRIEHQGGGGRGAGAVAAA